MATDASQFEFGAAAPAPMEVAAPKPRQTFGGMTPMQLAIGAALIAAIVWGMWTTRELLRARDHKIVSVRLSELVGQFANAEARSGDEPVKAEARTRAFMGALDKALKARAALGSVVLVGEAVISSSGDDITGEIAAEIMKTVPMPVAQALSPRLPVAPTEGGGASGVGQAMLGAFNGPPQGAPLSQVTGGSEPSPFPQGGAGPSAVQEGADAQP